MSNVNQGESFQGAISALEALVGDELQTADWIRSAEKAWQAIEAVSFDQKLTVFDDARRQWASALHTWISHVFSEVFDLARSQADYMEQSKVDWAEQKTREFVQRHFHQTEVTDDFDNAAFRLETTSPATTLDFWVKYACSGMENNVIPEDQQRAPRWLVAEEVPTAESDADVAGHVFGDLRFWFLTEIERSIVRERLKAGVALAKIMNPSLSLPNPTASLPRSSAEPRYLFKRRGNTWEVRFENGSAHTENLRGMLYISELLRHPDSPISVEELNTLEGVPVVPIVHQASR